MRTGTMAQTIPRCEARRVRSKELIDLWQFSDFRGKKATCDSTWHLSHLTGSCARHTAFQLGHRPGRATQWPKRCLQHMGHKLDVLTLLLLAVAMPGAPSSVLVWSFFVLTLFSKQLWCLESKSIQPWALRLAFWVWLTCDWKQVLKPFAVCKWFWNCTEMHIIWSICWLTSGWVQIGISTLHWHAL